MGIEEGNTRSYFQPIFLRQNAIFLQVFVYIYQYLSFKCQSCTPNLSLTKKLVKTLSLSSIFEGIIYSVFLKKRLLTSRGMGVETVSAVILFSLGAETK